MVFCIILTVVYIGGIIFIGRSPSGNSHLKDTIKRLNGYNTNLHNKIQDLEKELSQLRGRGFVLGENFPDIEALQFENGVLQNEINNNQKEINSLRMILISHGQICELNSKLKHKLSDAETEIRRQHIELTNHAVNVLNDDRDMKIGILKMINELNEEKASKLTVLLALMMIKLKQLNGDKT